MKNIKDDMYLLKETININTYERGVNTYNIIEINKDGNEKASCISIYTIEIDKLTTIFMGSNNSITKYILTDSVKNIKFNFDQEYYELNFRDGRKMILSPL